VLNSVRHWHLALNTLHLALSTWYPCARSQRYCSKTATGTAPALAAAGHTGYLGPGDRVRLIATGLTDRPDHSIFIWMQIRRDSWTCDSWTCEGIWQARDSLNLWQFDVMTALCDNVTGKLCDFATDGQNFNFVNYSFSCPKIPHLLKFKILHCPTQRQITPPVPKSSPRSGEDRTYLDNYGLHNPTTD